MQKSWPRSVLRDSVALVAAGLFIGLACSGSALKHVTSPAFEPGKSVVASPFTRFDHQSGSGQNSAKGESQPPNQGSAEQKTTDRKDNSKSELWFYAARGYLDNENLRCAGKAQVSRDSGKESFPCLDWELLDPKCTGSREAVDWLHKYNNKGQICRVNGNDWELKKHLPGQGFCDPHVTTSRNIPVEFSLDCTWKCRAASNPCAGEADYRFSRTPIKKRSE